MNKILRPFIIALPLIFGTPTCNQKSDVCNNRFHPDYLDAKLKQEERIVSPLIKPTKEDAEDYYIKIATGIKARDYKIGIFQEEYMPYPDTSHLEEEALKDTLFLDALATLIFTRQNNTDTLRPMMNPIPYINVRVYDTNLARDKFLESKYNAAIKIAIEKSIRDGYAITKNKGIKNVLVQYPFHFGFNTITAKRKAK
jgi:hypothetical protein